jgi:hypothetical protein
MAETTVARLGRSRHRPVNTLFKTALTPTILIEAQWVRAPTEKSMELFTGKGVLDLIATFSGAKLK